MQTSIDLAFGDGEYNFNLSWAGCAEVERASNAEIMVIYSRVLNGQASTSDMVEIIRQGLMGGSGGTVDDEPVETPDHVVARLIKRYVTGPDRQPISVSWTLAQAIISAAIIGYEPAKKNDGEAKKPQTSE